MHMYTDSCICWSSLCRIKLIAIGYTTIFELINKNLDQIIHVIALPIMITMEQYLSQKAILWQHHRTIEKKIFCAMQFIHVLSDKHWTLPCASKYETISEMYLNPKTDNGRMLLHASFQLKSYLYEF